MARRKIREQKSKVQGAKSVLTQLNQIAHEESHRVATSTSPTIASFAGTYRWS